MSILTRITPFLTDLTGGTLIYPANLRLRGIDINLSGTTDNSVLIYEQNTNQYEPVEGVEINDEIQKSFVYPLNDLLERLNSTLFTQTNSVTVANTTTETTLLGTGIGSKTLPAQFLTFGKTIKIEMWGKLSTASTVDFTLRYKLNSNTVAQTDSITLSPMTNKTFKIEIITTSRFIGLSGNTITQGYLTINQIGSGNPINFQIQDANISGTTISNASILPIDVTVQWGNASVNNTITSTNVVFKRYN